MQLEDRIIELEQKLELLTSMLHIGNDSRNRDRLESGINCSSNVMNCCNNGDGYLLSIDHTYLYIEKFKFFVDLERVIDRLSSLIISIDRELNRILLALQTPAVSGKSPLLASDIVSWQNNITTNVGTLKTELENLKKVLP